MLGFGSGLYSPRDLRTHKLRLLGPKTILYEGFGLFIPRVIGVRSNRSVVQVSFIPMIAPHDH